MGIIARSKVVLIFSALLVFAPVASLPKIWSRAAAKSIADDVADGADSRTREDFLAETGTSAFSDKSIVDTFFTWSKLGTWESRLLGAAGSSSTDSRAAGSGSSWISMLRRWERTVGIFCSRWAWLRPERTDSVCHLQLLHGQGRRYTYRYAVYSIGQL